MKILFIILASLGLASQVSSQIAEPDWIYYSNNEIAYDCWDEDVLGHVNALKPTHIADVTRKFCSGKAQETLIGAYGAIEEYREFEGDDGKRIPVLIRIIRRPSEEELKPDKKWWRLPRVRVPLDTCVKLMDVLIEGCPRHYSDDLARFGGGTAHNKPYTWVVELRPEKPRRKKGGD
ncbi:hypothetical protein FQN50_002880 [Emmonsiellopsis sp. PD_5]|nr:hypothetical protein FQN50_002880 [Emmonsiellopsis sp. PD_5]